VSVTLGENGVQWLDGDVVKSLEAFVVDVVDTAAAGDVFHGAFALALAEGLDEPAGFRFAAAAAALKCARPRARAGMPDRPAVDELVAYSMTVTR
jgi:sulfofructose kinase